MKIKPGEVATGRILCLKLLERNACLDESMGQSLTLSLAKEWGSGVFLLVLQEFVYNVLFVPVQNINLCSTKVK